MVLMITITNQVLTVSPHVIARQCDEYNTGCGHYLVILLRLVTLTGYHSLSTGLT